MSNWKGKEVMREDKKLWLRYGRGHEAQVVTYGRGQEVQ
jgi:hypothetical protein